MRKKVETELKEKNQEMENINEELNQRQVILEQRTKELGTMNKLMIGRELKMTELKQQVKQLQEKVG